MEQPHEYVLADAGTRADASVRAKGGFLNESLEYQWIKGEAEALAGQTRARLRFKKVKKSDEGSYCVKVWCKSRPGPVSSRAVKFVVSRDFIKR